jgi:hypothetical protein
VVEKRILKVLQAIPQFWELADDVRDDLIAANVPHAVALIVARGEGSTVAEQVSPIKATRVSRFNLHCFCKAIEISYNLLQEL